MNANTPKQPHDDDDPLLALGLEIGPDDEDEYDDEEYDEDEDEDPDEDDDEYEDDDDPDGDDPPAPTLFCKLPDALTIETRTVTLEQDDAGHIVRIVEFYRCKYCGCLARYVTTARLGEILSRGYEEIS